MVTIDPVVAERVAPQLSGGLVFPIHTQRSLQGGGKNRAHVIGCLGQFGVEAALSFLDRSQMFLFGLTQKLFFQTRADAGAEQNRVERFGKIILGAGFDAANDTFQLIDGGNHDDGDMTGLRISFELLQNAKAVEPWHHRVEQDNVEGPVADEIQCLSAVGGGFHFHSLALQAAGEHVAVALVVIRDEDVTVVPGEKAGFTVSLARGSGGAAMGGGMTGRGRGDYFGESLGGKFGIHQVEQLPGSGLYFFQIGEVILPSALDFPLQHFAATDNLVQRRTEFVAQLGKRVGADGRISHSVMC
jgi:hypothetical protein